MIKEKLSIWEIVRIASGLGLVIALPISGGTILGFLLDKNLKTQPILTIVFLLGGILLAFMATLRRIKEIK